jgi:hypothetical protein
MCPRPKMARFFFIRSLGMTELGVIPTDELTGLPYPIFFGPEHLALEKDFHHGWHSAVQVKQTYIPIVANALRSSRGYKVPKKFHEGASSLGYHSRLKGSVELPVSTSDVFEKVVLGCARVVPRQAIDLRVQGELKLATLEDDQHKFLADPVRTYVEYEYGNVLNREKSRDFLGSFFTYYALNSMLEESNVATDCMEILNASELKVRRRLGQQMMHGILKTIDDLLEPVEYLYNEAQTEGMVPEGEVDLNNTVRQFLPEYKLGEFCRTAMINQMIYPALQTRVDSQELAAA